MDNNFNDSYNGYTDKTYTSGSGADQMNGYMNTGNAYTTGNNGNSAPAGPSGYNGYTFNNQTYYAAPAPQDAIPINVDSTPISMWGYVGYLFLFHIPTAGFIVALIFALGASKNDNVKNLARAILIIDLIAAAVIALFYGSIFAMLLKDMH